MTLPPLPLPAHTFYPKRGKYQTFSADQMRAYGEACAAAERERAARVAEQQAECNGLAAGWHIAAEIRGPNVRAKRPAVAGPG